MTNEEKSKAFDWLVKNVEYFEHGLNGVKCRDIKVGAYWPQAADDSAPDEDFVDLDFTDYVMAMVKEEEQNDKSR